MSDTHQQKMGTTNIKQHQRTHIPVEGYKLEELQELPHSKLIEIAQELKIDNPNEFQRKDLIFEILKSQVSPRGVYFIYGNLRDNARWVWIFTLHFDSEILQIQAMIPMLVQLR